MTLGGLSGYQALCRTLRDVSSCSRHFGSISPSAQHAVDSLCLASLLHRWCTRLPATGPTPSGSTPCWTLRKCKVAGAKPTPKTKSSEWGCRGRGRPCAWDGAWKVSSLSFLLPLLPVCSMQPHQVRVHQGKVPDAGVCTQASLP